jgi:hypothetical protein
MATVHDPSVAETASVEIDGPGMNVKVKCSGPCNAQISERHGEMKVTLEVGTKRRRTEGGAGGSSLPPAVSQQFQLERIQRENKERETDRQFRELREKIENLADRLQSEDSDSNR